MNTIDNELNKIETLFRKIDNINDNLKSLIQAVLGDDTADTDRYAEALADAQHIQVVLEHSRIEEQEQEQEDSEEDE